MSNRPRLAGDGVLLVPGELAFNEAGASYVGALSGQTRDPFGWTSDRLLLAESFARLALDDPRADPQQQAALGVLRKMLK